MVGPIPENDLLDAIPRPARLKGRDVGFDAPALLRQLPVHPLHFPLAAPRTRSAQDLAPHRVELLRKQSERSIDQPFPSILNQLKNQRIGTVPQCPVPVQQQLHTRHTLGFSQKYGNFTPVRNDSETHSEFFGHSGRSRAIRRNAPQKGETEEKTANRIRREKRIRMKERAAAVARSPFGIMSRRLRAEDQASAPACRPADNAFQAAAARAAPAKGARDEHPQLRQRLAALEQSRGDRTRRIHRRPVTGMQTMWTRHERQTDDQSGEIAGPPLRIGRTERHQHEHERKERLGDQCRKKISGRKGVRPRRRRARATCPPCTATQRIAEPAAAPAICAAMYHRASTLFIRPLSQTPSVIAGLM